MQNFVGIHATRPEEEDLKALMTTEFRHFHPSLVHIIRYDTSALERIMADVKVLLRMSPTGRCPSAILYLAGTEAKLS